MSELVTLKEWQGMKPRAQGFVFYMQADWPGSELKGAANPYAEGTGEYAEFCTGEQMGVLEAQDSEE